MKPLALAATIVAALFAGCSTPGGANAEPNDIDLIVPGSWTVSAARDYSLAWVHNPTSAPMLGTWSLTGENGGPLPNGWKATFDPASATLGANGSKMDPNTRKYADWGNSLATLEVPTGSVGTHQLELHFADLTRQVSIFVKEPYGQVSAPGSDVTVDYDGKFHSDGTRFDDGSFPTTLGSGQTVTGFDYGLMGLALDETVTLQIPAALAYGYDNTDANYVKFNGQTLDFTVTMKVLPEPAKPVLGDALCAPYDDVADPRAPFPAESQDKVQVVIETTAGNFTVETKAAHAPKTVANFLQYVDDGFYSCTTVHRVAPGFVIQGGGFRSDYKTHKTTRAAIPLEATLEEKNLKGTLSMARTSSPNSATSEFFVNLADNPNLDPSGPNTGYAVFAKVIAGQDVVDKITAAKAGKSFGAGGFYPADPIVIIRAHRV